jgi:hypothetical protein
MKNVRESLRCFFFSSNCSSRFSAISFVVHIADYCSLCESLLTVAWINLLFLVVSRFLPSTRHVVH